jgi:hypothetical protein
VLRHRHLPHQCGRRVLVWPALGWRKIVPSRTGPRAGAQPGAGRSVRSKRPLGPVRSGEVVKRGEAAGQRVALAIDQPQPRFGLYAANARDRGVGLARGGLHRLSR